MEQKLKNAKVGFSAKRWQWNFWKTKSTCQDDKCSICGVLRYLFMWWEYGFAIWRLTLVIKLQMILWPKSTRPRSSIRQTMRSNRSSYIRPGLGSKMETTKKDKTILLKAGHHWNRSSNQNKCNLQKESIASGCETLLFCVDSGCIIKSIFVSGGRMTWLFHITSSGNCS